jgi:hypothetical protein
LDFAFGEECLGQVFASWGCFETSLLLVSKSVQCAIVCLVVIIVVIITIVVTVVVIIEQQHTLSFHDVPPYIGVESHEGTLQPICLV